MKVDLVKLKLIGVIGEIQSASGYGDTTTIEDQTVPLEGLEGFDSTVAPIAMRRLALALEIEIPNNRNIFREGGRSSGRKLSVAEIAAEIVAGASNCKESGQ